MVASHQGVSDGVASDKAAVLPFYCTCYTVQYGTVLYSTMGKVLTVLYGTDCTAKASRTMNT